MKKNLLLLLSALIASGFLIEILCRLTGHYISYYEKSSGTGYVSPFQSRSRFGYGWDETPKPFSTVECYKLEFHYVWKANNEGLRGPNLSIRKTGKRILVFGDSFTEGMGAPDDSTYPYLLGQLINHKLDSTAEVINCGPSGSDLFTEYKLFTGKMLKYQPDYVLATFNSTDLFEFSTRGGFERFKKNNKVEYRKPPWFEPLYAKSYLFRFVLHDVLKYDYRYLSRSNAKAMDSLSVKAYCAVIDSFNLLCKANGSQFGMVFHPLRFEYQENFYPVTDVISYCKQQHIPYADDAAFMKQAGIGAVNDLYYMLDGHFNSRGYHLLAQCAYELFQREGWLKGFSSHQQGAKQPN
jgi:lysophospholipase L1-like esterase